MDAHWWDAKHKTSSSIFLALAMRDGKSTTQACAIVLIVINTNETNEDRGNSAHCRHKLG